MNIKLISVAVAIAITICLNAQRLNTEIIIEGQEPYLVGQVDKSGLLGKNYRSWFTENYNNYKPNDSLINLIAPALKEIEIKIFMGTWCGDSRRDVPNLYRILEACNFPMKNLLTVALSNEDHMYKKSPQQEEVGLNIHRVPTIIFYKNGKEINRIVEYPVKTLEEDILEIISGNDYESNYYIVTELNQILKKEGTIGLKEKTDQLLKKYKGQVYDASELNAYGKLLLDNKKIEEGIAVLQFNTLLLPEDSYTFLDLADILSDLEKNDEAIIVLESGLKTHPNDEDLKQKLKMLNNN
ncbi:thioredoxin family protein [Winogradskyella alexanderae]|uniref:Thioredoxin family protein n=1 Tax=Winogradskyella alexanderae TaxID=2877123 RepID=A0ABS7XTB7_9FLAO|nr:thioredoxin family protein [Winogradskyella alexanderae]MCA0133255.1 thioredoxin family protein [Winogradskyella alexanderae]